MYLFRFSFVTYIIWIHIKNIFLFAFWRILKTNHHLSNTNEEIESNWTVTTFYWLSTVFDCMYVQIMYFLNISTINAYIHCIRYLNISDQNFFMKSQKNTYCWNLGLSSHRWKGHACTVHTGETSKAKCINYCSTNTT